MTTINTQQPQASGYTGMLEAKDDVRHLPLCAVCSKPFTSAASIYVIALNNTVPSTLVHTTGCLAEYFKPALPWPRVQCEEFVVAVMHGLLGEGTYDTRAELEELVAEALEDKIRRPLTPLERLSVGMTTSLVWNQREQNMLPVQDRIAEMEFDGEYYQVAYRPTKGNGGVDNMRIWHDERCIEEPSIALCSAAYMAATAAMKRKPRRCD